MDVAVLRIARVEGLRRTFVFKSLGDAAALKAGERLYSIGYSHGSAWYISLSDVFSRSIQEWLAIQNCVGSPGQAGGPVVDDRWKLVGIMIERDSVECRALRIDRVVLRLKAWHFPVSLRS
jgi:hypothetical protein